jgi:hypothetical protein
MGLIGRTLTRGAIASAGEAAEGLSEVFVANATRRMELEGEAFRSVLEHAAEEFRHSGSAGFDRFVNGLNRLPRPLMALGTMGLFTFAMVEPAAFALRMQGLAEVPEPLWWLMGAIVGFYFGAREMHYLRQPRGALAGGLLAGLFGRRARADGADENPALSEWLAQARDE